VLLTDGSLINRLCPALLALNTEDACRDIVSPNIE
jgi:hypothetical protein